MGNKDCAVNVGEEVDVGQKSQVLGNDVEVVEGFVSVGGGPVVDEEGLGLGEELLEVGGADDEVDAGEGGHVVDVGAVSANNNKVRGSLEVVQEVVAPAQVVGELGRPDGRGGVYGQQSELTAVDRRLIVVVGEKHFPPHIVNCSRRQGTHSRTADLPVGGRTGILSHAHDLFVGEGW